MPAENTQTFSFETVATLVAAIVEKGGNVSHKEYAQMAKLDGVRTASSFDHQFRKVKARAKELIEAGAKNGGTPPAKSTPKATAKKTTTTTAGTGKKAGAKRGRKAKEEVDSVADEGEAGEESPTKKIKAEPQDDDDGDEGEATWDGTYDGGFTAINK